MSMKINKGLIVLILTFNTCYAFDYMPIIVDATVIGTNGSIAHFELSVSLAALSTGNFVVTWQSYTSNTSSNCFYMVSTPTADSIKSQTKVNSTAAYNVGCSVAADKSGGFAITWNEMDVKGSATVNNVYVKYYDSSLTSGTELKVNSIAPNAGQDTVMPTINFNTTGKYMIVWNPNSVIYGQQVTQAINPAKYLTEKINRIGSSISESFRCL
jgi:hypothetical protein